MCSMPRETASDVSKTPPSRFFSAFSSLSEEVLSRLRRLFSSSTSSRASTASAPAFAAASATRSSRPAMFLAVPATKSWTSPRSFAALASSSWYCSRTSAMKVALCAAIVWEAVRKCSRTSLTTLPTVWRIAVTELFASCTSFPTSVRSVSSCAASALPACSAATSASSVPRAIFVFLSSPATLARPVSSPHTSSVRALCRSSMPASLTSTLALYWLFFRFCSSRRTSKFSRWLSCSSKMWLSSVAIRSTLRCRWCSADSFCSRL
mmetsp:Transcript_55482/g.156158  ORF Transcript_55482/g.156158 Transcript_55482/m.156158 type:complete len:265 (-) Transcript_55482:437-1231(-)